MGLIFTYWCPCLSIPIIVPDKQNVLYKSLDILGKIITFFSQKKTSIYEGSQSIHIYWNFINQLMLMLYVQT